MVAIFPQLTRIIAGVSVPNTALINSSIELAHANLPSHGYNHVMRSWLNGQTIINHLPHSERANVDVEAFGVAAILHDMGWAFNTSFVSGDKIFEVDGANTARDLIRKMGGKAWGEHRVQLVWDAIALHTSFDIAKYKQTEVAITAAGTVTELFGPVLGKQVVGDMVTVTQAEWDNIAAAFPRPGLKEYVKGVFIDLCTMKPAATGGNSAGDWGEKYVQGYSRAGHRPMDLVETSLPE